MNGLKTKLALLALGALTAQAASAATLTSASADLFDADTDVSTNGTLVEAVNVNGAAVTVNGVTFAAHSLASSGFALLANTMVSGSPQNADFVSGTGSGSSASAVTLMDTGERSSGSTSPTYALLEFTGLTSGLVYEFQVFSKERIGLSGNNVDLFLSDTNDGTPNVSEMDVVTSLYDTTEGVILTGTFTADSVSQTLHLFAGQAGVNGEVPLGGTFVQAYQLRVVPEPGSLALLGLGGLLIARRRRA